MQMNGYGDYSFGYPVSYAPPYISNTGFAPADAKPSGAVSSRVSTKVWSAVAAIAVIALVGLATGMLVFFETNDDVGPFAAYIRTNNAFTIAGAVMLGIGLAATVIGLATRDRGLLIFAAAVLFTIAGYFGPQYLPSVSMQAFGICVAALGLVCTYLVWRVGESIQEESEMGAGLHAVQRNNKFIKLSMKQVQLICYILGILYILCGAGLLGVSEAQENPQNPSTKTWNFTVAFVQFFIGILMFVGVKFSMRGVLIITAVFAFFVVNLYATWVAAVAWAEKNLDYNCGNAAASARLPCQDKGFVTAELAFNWINWALSLLVIWAAYYYSERMQSWDEAEEHGVDRDLSDPCRILGVPVEKPIELCRYVLFACNGFIAALALVVLTVGCLMNGNNGLPKPAVYSPSPDPVVLAVFALVAVLVGVWGAFRRTRTPLIFSLVVLLWITAYAFNIMVESIFAVLDGVTSTTFVVSQLTGYEEGVTIITAIYCGLIVGSALLAACVTWIMMEALQDKRQFAGKGLAGFGSYSSPISAPPYLPAYPTPSPAAAMWPMPAPSPFGAWPM